MALKLNPNSAPAYQEFAQVMIDCFKTQGTEGLLGFVAECERAINDWKLAQPKVNLPMSFVGDAAQRCSLCGGRLSLTPTGWVCPDGHGVARTNPMPQPTQPKLVHPLTDGQQQAWENINRWLKTSDSFFLLRGYAGTGKSYLMQMLLSLNANLIFSAPTNKATAVLSDFLGIQAKTIYSVLGMRMDADEDKLKLTVASTLPDLGRNPILVIDEAGMIPKFMADLLADACRDRGWRVIFVGDPAQLNPVGEDRSIVWSMAKPENRSLLSEVVRFDNELLKLSMRIRKRIRTENYAHGVIKDDHANDKEGVFVVTKKTMLQTLESLKLADWTDRKVVCWRNRTVDAYNDRIRAALGFTNPFEVGENILMASPLFGEGGVLAYTDEELQVTGISTRMFSYPEGSIESYVLAVADRSFSLYIPKNESRLTAMLDKRAETASKATRGRKEAWKSFWDLKNTFQNVKYGYCVTTHRMQGSTVKHAYIDQQDILANPNKLEAYRCLYVAATRPQLTLTTY